MNLFKDVSPHNEGWRALRKHLIEAREARIKMLVGMIDHDKSNELRGAIRFIDTLLVAEDAAIKEAAQRG